jgi:hypothetical protein
MNVPRTTTRRKLAASKSSLFKKIRPIIRLEKIPSITDASPVVTPTKAVEQTPTPSARNNDKDDGIFRMPSAKNKSPAKSVDPSKQDSASPPQAESGNELKRKLAASKSSLFRKIRPIIRLETIPSITDASPVVTPTKAVEQAPTPSARNNDKDDGIFRMPNAKNKSPAKNVDPSKQDSASPPQAEIGNELSDDLKAPPLQDACQGVAKASLAHSVDSSDDDSLDRIMPMNKNSQEDAELNAFMVEQLEQDERITPDEDDEDDLLWAYKSGYHGPQVTDSHETDSEDSPNAMSTYGYPDGIPKKSASRHLEITRTYIPERKLKAPPKKQRGRLKKKKKEDQEPERPEGEYYKALLQELESQESKDSLIKEGSIVYGQWPPTKGKCQKEGYAFLQE